MVKAIPVANRVNQRGHARKGIVVKAGGFVVRVGRNIAGLVASHPVVEDHRG